MRRTFLVAAICLMAGTAAAEVTYRVEADSERVLLNSSARVECEQSCPVNSWSITLRKPAEAEITRVESSLGEVRDYTVQGDRVTVETYHEDGVNSEIVEIGYRLQTDAEKVTEGLYRRDISLPGFSGESNSGVLEVEDLISGEVYRDAAYSMGEENITFRGSGALNARVVFGSGERTENFEFFPRSRDEGRAFDIAAGTLGSLPKSRRLPVVVLSPESYDSEVNPWSSGQYSGSVIFVKDDLGSRFQEVLAHETVHAINDQRLEWRADSAWMDEGLAKYVEFLVEKRRKGSSRVAELFGKEVSYTVKENGSTYRYTVPPRGDRDELWAYYQENKTTMKSWSSRERERGFGYAYSELIVRNHLKEAGSIRQLYSDLQEIRVDGNEEKWREVSGLVDLTPCKRETRERFERCLEEVNGHDYPVFAATDLDREQDVVTVQELEPAEPAERKSARGRERYRSPAETSLLQLAFERLASWIGNLTGMLGVQGSVAG